MFLVEKGAVGESPLQYRNRKLFAHATSCVFVMGLMSGHGFNPVLSNLRIKPPTRDAWNSNRVTWMSCNR